MFRSSGLLLIDKPKAMTSHDVVGRLRRILRTKAIGHSGTLDPLATGLMVALINEGTKLSDYFRDGRKGYTVTVQLGVISDTLDVDGQIESTGKELPSWQEVSYAVQKLQGDLQLPVPMFSAVKVDGKRLYKSARQGKELETPVRVMVFDSVELVEYQGDQLVCHLECSKGSFVRSWVKQLGEDLGCGAIVKELRRTLSAPYRVENALSLDELAELVDEKGELVLPERLSGQNSVSRGFSDCLSGPEGFAKAFVSVSDSLSHWPAMTVKGRDEFLMGNGQIPNELQKRLVPTQKEAARRGRDIGVRVLGGRGQLIALLHAIPNKGLKIRRKFKEDC